MIKINKIAIVDEYNTAYTLKDDVLFFQHISEDIVSIPYINLTEGFDFYEDWQEVDIEMMGDQFDYESIIKSLKGEE